MAKCGRTMVAFAAVICGVGGSSVASGQSSTPIEPITFNLAPELPAPEPEPTTSAVVESVSSTPDLPAVDPGSDHGATGDRRGQDGTGPSVLAIAPVSETAAAITAWVISSGDNHGRPFIVIDKVAAEVFVYDANGQQLGVTPALLGIAQGDDATPGVGDRELAEIGPAERTTPAGRFVAQIGPARGNQKVLWVDYATSVALHPVVTGNRKERRQERLDSPTPSDNRITFGCINVPAKFFDDLVRPLFNDANGIVYVLPDTKFLIEVFPGFQAGSPSDQIARASS